MGKIRHLTNRTIETLKDEGVKSLAKKTKNYVYLRAKGQKMFAVKDVLFINGCTLPHPTRYRVDHQIEQLESSGLSADKIFYEQLNLDKIKYYRAFVFYRCPITDTIKEFIKVAKSYNKVIFYDIDDLVFDKKYTDTIKYVKQMNKADKALYDDGVKRMGETLKLCDYAITTTEPLAHELKPYVKEVFVNRNVASEEMTHKMEDLSEGQKCKILLAGLILEEREVLVLDEPSRNLSPLSNPELRRMLKEYKGCILAVSHDRMFIDEVADTVYELDPTGLHKIV